ncbi:uncharacterized protein B0I36DRAFT_10522 [Microdochium trichocladiopsis]|uniref:Uncharacterized protein n=1 Tax=Microdochium trichocladiopsis TaxID=1682393 RepID=A0A9P8YK17_9PEZI|nr:uncharacterized protein B0I36DRAFT_10522 [Microdochium trichocladiopsis]KAH7040449.1 hypothetical protein B0I36DRAFT_10522 [Microdochium trichocladiopsis]
MTQYSTRGPLQVRLRCPGCRFTSPPPPYRQVVCRWAQNKPPVGLWVRGRRVRRLDESTDARPHRADLTGYSTLEASARVTA